jgi:serine/threonine-protein kinase
VTGQAADLFISYKAEDSPRLVPLVEALEAEGFSVWWDTHIGGGANWREDIQEHLDSAKCVIVAWTKRSIGHAGNFVRDEASRAQRHGTYLPIRLDPVDPPLGFGEVQAISLKGWHGDPSDPRFIALADAVREYITGQHTERPSAGDERAGVSRRAVVAGGIGIGAVAAASVSGWLLLKPAPANAMRIAVLPFANLSGDPSQAYFSDGIAEELRSALTRAGMQVIGRTSSDAVKNMDAKAAAARLSVANILTGSVRRSPSVIRVNAQLVNGKDGVQKWAQTYDRSPGDAIKIQTDIAENVARALSIALSRAGRAALTVGGTTDSVAQDLILQVRQISREATGPDALRRRVALAEAAIGRDPNYADAYVEKATALTNLASNYGRTPADVAHQVAQADVAARRAVALAPTLGSAHAALATIARARLDFAGALREANEALARAPHDPNLTAVEFVAVLGRSEDAVRAAELSMAFDPLNARSYGMKSEALLFSRRYQEAVEAGRRALELAPERWGVRLWIGDALLLLGQTGKAMAEYQALQDEDPFRPARLALVAARTGDRAGAQRMVREMKQQIGATFSFQYAEVYAQLTDADRVFAEFDNAVKAKDAGLSYLKVDPFLDPIRSDPRFAALLRRLNFP